MSGREPDWAQFVEHDAVTVERVMRDVVRSVRACGGDASDHYYISASLVAAPAVDARFPSRTAAMAWASGCGMSAGLLVNEESEGGVCVVTFSLLAFVVALMKDNS